MRTGGAASRGRICLILLSLFPLVVEIDASVVADDGRKYSPNAGKAIFFPPIKLMSIDCFRLSHMLFTSKMKQSRISRMKGSRKQNDDTRLPSG